MPATSKRDSIRLVAALALLAIPGALNAGDIGRLELPPFELIKPDVGSIQPGQTSDIKIVRLVPNCPSGFDVATHTPNHFVCETYVAGNAAAGTAFVAQQKPCEFPGYWNIGPEVIIKPVRGAAQITWTCEHL